MPITIIEVESTTMLGACFRALAVALLVLAVPVQGLAAVNAGLCMAFGGHDAGHDHHSEAPADEHQHDSSNHQDSSGAHCAPCVSCCAATAIAPTLKLVVAEAGPIVAVSAPQYWIAGVSPDGLFRPPLAL